MRTPIALDGDSDSQDAPSVHRWMVSYADFISLLFILFLVLYAKLPKQPEAVPQQPAKPALQQAAALPPPTATAPAEPALEPQPDAQSMLLGDLAASLRDLVAAGDVTLVRREEGILLEIRDTALFPSGSAQPSEQSRNIFARISAVLARAGNAVIVEGHTDDRPIQTSQYPSNWELSTARAAAVVRALQERGVQPGRLTAAGLAETKPRTSNDTAEGRSQNRRVSLLLLNGPAPAAPAAAAADEFAGR